MRIHKQRVIITITALLLIVFSLGCIPKSDNPGFDMEPVSYHGEDMDLYTVAAYNVLGAGNPGTTIRRIETDQFGRTLFEVSFFQNMGIGYIFKNKAKLDYIRISFAKRQNRTTCAFMKMNVGRYVRSPKISRRQRTRN